MEITREELSAIIVSEVRRRLRELVEASGEDDSTRKPKQSKGKQGKVPTTTSADQESDPAGPAVDGDRPDPEAEDETTNDRPESDDTAAIDADGDAGEEPSGAVNDEVSGKTVQAVTIEAQSKILPGAKEVVLAFNETTDPLRILVTPTGMVKFFWRGQLHDLP